MSLTQTLMNGGMYGACSIDAARYNHDNGALRIATESVEELHDIFMTTFYATEQAELGAVSEGVALEESSYAAVYEGAIKDAFGKVKEFFKKLWDKVKAWCHNVKRFFDALFMSGKDFVKKYKNDIAKATNIKDFSYNMYKYNNDVINKAPDSIDVDEQFQGIIGSLSDVVSFKDDGSLYSVNTKFEEVKKAFSDENLCKEIAKQTGLGNNVTDSTEFRKAAFGKFRNGAEDKTDKEDIDVSDLSTYAKYLEDTVTISKIDAYTRKVDNAYKKAIKFIDDTASKLGKEEPKGTTDREKEADKDVRTNGPKTMSILSSSCSYSQSLFNIVMDEWKKVIKERDGVYKQLIIAGLSNNRKNSKKK